MNSISKLSIQLFFLFLFCTLVGCNTSDKQGANVESKNTIVLVKYKTQPDKGALAVTELTQLIEQVKLEPHFIKIKLHLDPKDSTNILLYEEWSDGDYYNGKHMNTTHLKAFIANSRNFLAGPPEISLWEVKNIVK